MTTNADVHETVTTNVDVHETVTTNVDAHAAVTTTATDGHGRRGTDRCSIGLDGIRACNPELDVMSVQDPRFVEYGVVHRIESAGDPPSDGPLLTLARQRFDRTDDPVAYVASSPELEACPELREIERRVFGEVEVQAGCCWGTSTRMNGMEFHRSSELVGAATELVLVLGRLQEVHDGRWDSHRAAFVHVPAGTFVELFATTLHLAPCRVARSPFCAVIVLPRGTNTPLADGPDGWLWMRNKWLLAHPDGPAAARGAWVGIDGPNWRIRPH